MPFHSQSTPESLLPRSDSKNPATTCKGITSNGRPCRRSLAQSPQSSPGVSPIRGRGVLAVVPNVDGHGEGAAAFYCWQHKDQANALRGTADGDTEIVNLRTRTSTDSLAARLGVFTIEEEEGTVGNSKTKRSEGYSRPVRRETLPQTWQNVPSPLISVTTGDKRPQAGDGRRRRHERRHRKGDLHVSFFCCMRSPDAEQDAPVAPRPVPHKTLLPSGATTSPKPTSDLHMQSSTPHKKNSNAPSAAPSPRSQSSQPTGNNSQSAYTQALLSFIPSSTSPNVTKLLLAELSKPLTPSDRESGYIYIFWLTPQNTPHPAASDASTLLAGPFQPVQGRQASDILRTYSVKAPSRSAGRGTRHLMLKIGRASNVTRRMTEWYRQCGHHITLLRYYPYLSKSGNSPSPSPRKDRNTPSPRPATGPQQVPLVSRVERLIHVALQEQRVMRDCDGCGKTHREWFEIEASKEGIRRVDAIVKRWVEWAIEEGKD